MQRPPSIALFSLVPGARVLNRRLHRADSTQGSQGEEVVPLADKSCTQTIIARVVDYLKKHAEFEEQSADDDVSGLCVCPHNPRLTANLCAKDAVYHDEVYPFPPSPLQPHTKFRVFSSMLSWTAG